MIQQHASGGVDFKSAKKEARRAEGRYAGQPTLPGERWEEYEQKLREASRREILGVPIHTPCHRPAAINHVFPD